MKFRSINTSLYAHPMDMGGFPIRQPFPAHTIDQIDPFLLLHHAEVKVPSHIEPNHAGVGPHPHRGFSPVTFIFKGGVHHRDSRGNDNVVYDGGIQWMNAGMGVIHSERPPADIHERGGFQELIQLWINTPAIHKMDQPLYFPLSEEEIPTIRDQNGLVSIKVVAGELEGIKGKAPAQSPVNLFTVDLKDNGKHAFEIPIEHQAFVYLLHGKIKINDSFITESKHAIVFNNDGEGFELQAMEDSLILIGTGAPLNEKVVSHGPFVMNSSTEIMQAFKDYQLGKMGVLIEE